MLAWKSCLFGLEAVSGREGRLALTAYGFEVLDCQMSVWGPALAELDCTVQRTPTALAALPPKLGSKHHPPTDNSCKAASVCTSLG